MRIHTILLIALFTLSAFNTYAMHTEKLVQEDNALFFDMLPDEVLIQIVAYCYPTEKNALMRTNHYLCYCASTENYKLILHQSPLLLYSKDQTHYLMSCIQTNEIKIFKNLLHNGANPNTITPSCSSLLYYAITKHCTKAAKLLIEETNVDVNIGGENNNHSVPLYIAAQEGCAEIVESLLNHKKIDTTLTFRDGFSPCYVAAQRGNAIIVKILLDHDETFLNKACKEGSTPLYIAAQEGHTEVIKLLLTYPKTNANSRYKRGFTPMYVAARNGHMQAVELFLNHSDVLVDTSDEDGSTALYVAAQNGHEKVAALLLADSRVNTNPLFLDGYTPLYIAAQNGHTRIVRTLLTRADLDINKIAPNGANALYIASQNGYPEIVKLLLAHPDIQVNTKTNHGFSPLYIAAYKGCIEIMKLLIAYDENLVNEPSETERFSPLHIACTKGQLEAVFTLLVPACININALTTYDETPLDLALEHNHTQVAELLITNGALQNKIPKKKNIKPIENNVINSDVQNNNNSECTIS